MKDNAAVLELTQRISVLADSEGHHPRMTVDEPDSVSAELSTLSLGMSRPVKGHICTVHFLRCLILQFVVLSRVTCLRSGQVLKPPQRVVHGSRVALYSCC